MRRIVIVFVILLSSNSSNAQWRNIANFIDSSSGFSESISDIYFIDHPGPPRVGFVGTEPELWKTTDGGNSWFKSWANDIPDYSGAFVQGICFKDSMTGWFLYDIYYVYKTTNGGSSWQPASQLPPSFLEYGANDIHYCSSSNRLLVSGLFTDLMAVSTDLGNTWSTVNAGQYGSFAFSNDSMGILSVGEDSINGIQDTSGTGAILRTTDAGRTWFVTDTGFICWQPLAIPGTPICFANGSTGLYQTRVFRSDNYGQTWRVLYTFPFSYDTLTETEIAPFEDGSMVGDLTHLYINSDSGTFVSTDEGITWTLMTGTHPGYARTIGIGCLYHGEVFAGMSYTPGVRESGGLWEEDTGLAAGVAEQQAQDSCFEIIGPYPNPSAVSGENVSALVHYCAAGATITAQVYNIIGGTVGSPVTIISDGQIWDRIDIPAPSSAGIYYIHVSVPGFSDVLSYSVF